MPRKNNKARTSLNAYTLLYPLRSFYDPDITTKPRKAMQHQEKRWGEI